MRITVSALVLAAALAVPTFAQQGEKVAAPPVAVAPAKPVVQIAILLDTSNSMDGLIDQARTQLWKIVNEFAKARMNGQHPDIKVALYQYGTPSLGAQNQFVKQLVPLTDDLDKISEELFKLKTDGGDEYCGAVIKKAAEELDWSAAKDAYKAIFIAGNEPFTQGPIDFHDSCKEAIGKGILINTIFCGADKEGIDTHWKDGAVLADGSYLSINQEAKVAQIAAPQDKEIAELGAKLNTTYVGFGAAGGRGAANQAAQDKNAAATAPAGAPAVERSITKASASYTNGTWDLVDAVNGKKVDLEKIKDEDLPKEMQGMDEKQRENFVAEKTRERAQMQERIKTLATEREKYIAEQAKAQPESTLDKAILTTVHSQATKNGMTFEAPK
ncbi:MAG TPA: VWA domain-containing protein [Phycisphaerae bacterium]|nr:VWA domain-containing protein [Phycisphaerae bacterium]